MKNYIECEVYSHVETETLKEGWQTVGMPIIPEKELIIGSALAKLSYLANFKPIKLR